ncbi:glycosyl hydrolase family 95 catalytic domain-containing protein [Glycomyces algeriensis]|uniref:Large protein n=1 Tax=Glycomyces algeriensis TaxID=256037 RepID=A0A9W6LIS1_9ACTN|nr:glycoside hydrolase N-terminal domain-containing protein [Glycomyces algeriensis]MDA1365551.1 glycoside hydrolase N-terminal domain-containing protein [Glycomyces algeriensis]GLI43951.1 large protein [Glycomyces algeriensis]
MAALRRRQVMKYGAASALAAPLQWAAPGTASAAARPAGDLSLWYDEQAGTDWLRALPVGNGRLGAMVFGNSGTERLQLNEDTVWAGGPHDYSNTAGANSLQQIRQLVFADQWGQAQDLINQTMLGKPAGQLAYQPVGDLNLAFPGIGGTSEYERWLDLTTAATGVSYLANGVRYQREVIATAPDQVIAVRLTAGTAGRISFTASFNTPQRATKSSPDSRTIALDGRSGDQRGIPGAVRFLALARAVAEGGSTSSSGGSLQVTNANAVTLLVSIGTSYVDYQNANGDYQGAAWNRLNAAGNRSYADLRARHAADYRELFDRTVIDLGRTAAADQTTDTRISQHGSGTDPQFSALLFQYGRYLLISSSRPGTQPANLQGIWNDSLTPSWESKYTLNANLPMNYWPADSTNLAECFEPVFDMIEDLTETGARTADVQYGAGGWVAHHNTDGWRGSSVVDDARWGMWPTGGAWLATMIWDHYRFTGDRGFLEANYPAMKGAAQFFLETLVEHPSLGWLVTNPSNSPEMLHHNDATVCAGPTMDNQILRDLFNGCASASEVLGIDADFRTQVRAARDRLAPMRVGSRGNIMEYLHDWIETDPQHRHVSHLYGLHPSNQITKRGTPQLFTAARRTLELRGDAGTGWSLAWKINYWARLEEGTRAHDLIRQLVTPERLAPNMFDLHPPFQIDGNFGATSGIAEMLLQSHNGELHLLPALPAAWPAGSVSGLRGRGGHTIGATWSGGTIDDLTVRPDRTGAVKVRSRMFTGDYELVDESNGAVIVPREPEGDVIEFDAQAGRTYRATALGGGSAVEPGVNYRLVAQHSGKAADVNGASTAAGATAIQWAIHSGANQQFDFVDAGGGYWRIRARHSGLVLQVSGIGTGADITQQASSGATTQQWQVTDHGGGIVSLVNRASGLALDVWSASTADGARLSQWNYTGSSNQRFELRRA